MQCFSIWALFGLYVWALFGLYLGSIWALVGPAGLRQMIRRPSGLTAGPTEGWVGGQTRRRASKPVDELSGPPSKRARGQVAQPRGRPAERTGGRADDPVHGWPGTSAFRAGRWADGRTGWWTDAEAAEQADECWPANYSAF
jgi:hypothetical protein